MKQVFKFKKSLLLLPLLILLCFPSFSQSNKNVKKVLIVNEGTYDMKSHATGVARQLGALLGHFETAITFKGVNQYKTKDIEKFDYIFYVGYSSEYSVPKTFTEDILKSTKPIIWINSGLMEFSKNPDFVKQFGFIITGVDKNSDFFKVVSNKKIFTKGSPEINLISIHNKSSVEVIASAWTDKTKKSTPYIIQSNHLVYIADLPFKGATETDRYLLFSDLLHDFLHENHPEKHSAIVRIEDVTPIDNPDKIRDIADILSSRNIPFLIGVVPFYVNPSEDRRVSLTDKPEMVDALKYAVRNGATLVMHGVTHQYKGVSTDDFEFWNGMTKKPISDETEDEISQKIETGINEFIKNGLYPLLWETPHYTASQLTYSVVSKYFSSAIEQRLSIEDFDYGQYFPYIINKDLFGQKVYPENLGYIPFNSNPDTGKVYVKNIISNSASMLNVRDGIACFFFHSFLDLNLLKTLVDGIQAKGFTFIDLGMQSHWVKCRDKVILAGTQYYSVNLDNSFLYEMYLNTDGDITRKYFSPNRIKGKVSKIVHLQPGEMYVAEPVDYYIKEHTFSEKVWGEALSMYQDFIHSGKDWKEAKVKVCWNQYAKGANFNDQASFVSMFNSLNINVDTIFVQNKLDLTNCNLLVVPYSFVDSLSYSEKFQIVKWVQNGGNLITDYKNRLIEKFDIKFLNSTVKVFSLHDKFYPYEHINWKYDQLVKKFEFSDDDEVFCSDATTGLAMALGKKFGKGKLIYFNSLFDPYSMQGYSNYPYAMIYVKNFLNLQPFVKRNNLEFYFDPGLRQTTSIENLIKLWLKEGIRIIHVAGWHQYPKFNYDYKRLISLAHANGILVYAWLEPPQLNNKFWNEHPEWREKNYKNNDARPAWRYPLALTDEKCLNTVLNEYLKFIKQYDFDGVNIGEMYFESGKSFSHPEQYTPMHISACNEVKKRFNIDLRQIFNPNSIYYWKTHPTIRQTITNYRIEKVTALHDRFLKAFKNYANTKPGFKIMVTTMDTYGSPELKEEVGIDIDSIIKLQKKYGFLLQVEDPASKWSTDPERYEAIGKFFISKGVPKKDLLLDLNILSFRDKNKITPFPTLIQTGIESYHLIHSSSLGAPRFTIYSEASVNPQDISFFSYASAGDVDYNASDNGYEVNSPYSFTITLPKHIKFIQVDGDAMLGYNDNSFLIPAGKHTIKYITNEIGGFSTVEIQPQIISISGNLLAAEYDMRKIFFTYESEGRTIVSFNNEPSALLVDNVKYPFTVMKGNDCYSIFLPSGKHQVELTVSDTLSYGINLTSLWSSNAIVIYGGLAVLLLFIMYIMLKIIRRKKNIN